MARPDASRQDDPSLATDMMKGRNCTLLPYDLYGNGVGISLDSSQKDDKHNMDEDIK